MARGPHTALWASLSHPQSVRHKHKWRKMAVWLLFWKTKKDVPLWICFYLFFSLINLYKYLHFLKLVIQTNNKFFVCCGPSTQFRFRKKLLCPSASNNDVITRTQFGLLLCTFACSPLVTVGLIPRSKNMKCDEAEAQNELCPLRELWPLSHVSSARVRAWCVTWRGGGRVLGASLARGVCVRVCGGVLLQDWDKMATVHLRVGDLVW